MTNDNDLKSLEDRLKAARRNDNQPVEAETNSQAGMAWRMGAELVTSVIVGLYIGSYIDDWLDSKPIAMITLVVLGFAAGIRNVIVTATKMQNEANESETKDS